MRVIDRRMFTADGELREEVRQELAELEAARPAEPPAPSPPAAPPAPTPEAGKEAPPGSPAVPDDGPADPGFARLVMTLSNQAGLCLGLLVDPLNPAGTVDLGVAKTFIDMLTSIQKKTAGNLNNEEAQLLESVLYELQMAYVERSRRPSRG